MVSFKDQLIKYIKTGELYESKNSRRMVKRGTKEIQVDKGVKKPCYYDVLG